MPGNVTDLEFARQRDPKEPEQQHRGWRRRIRHFTWNWFSSTMSTGAVAVVLAQTPYKFTGLRIIGKIFFIVDLVMFLAFSALMIARFVIRPQAISKSFQYPPEALHFGTYLVSLALILNCTQAYAVPSCGPWLITALRVCFWTYVAVAIMVAVSQYATIFIMEKLPVSSAMPAWILPMYSFLVLGPLSAIIAPSQPPEYAQQILLGGIAFQGLGFTVSIFMYTIYFLRMMSSEVPAPSTRPGMFISVGPAGYTSAAFVALGVQAQSVLPPGTFGTALPVGEVLRILGITAGIFLWLLTFWFFAIAWWGIINGISRMEFSLSWWAFIFPNGGFTLATIQIGEAIDSRSIKLVSSVMTVLLVIAWLVISVLCVKAFLQKKVMWPGRDDDKKLPAP